MNEVPDRVILSGSLDNRLQEDFTLQIHTDSPFLFNNDTRESEVSHMARVQKERFSHGIQNRVRSVRLPTILARQTGHQQAQIRTRLWILTKIYFSVAYPDHLMSVQKQTPDHPTKEQHSILF